MSFAINVASYHRQQLIIEAFSLVNSVIYSRHVSVVYVYVHDPSKTHTKTDNFYAGFLRLFLIMIKQIK